MITQVDLWQSWLKNLRYILMHKWHVLIAGWRLGGIPLWRLIIHDFSKFMPSEFFAYAAHFFAGDPRKGSMHDPGNSNAFDRAWIHHLHWNPHHHQHWIMIKRDGSLLPLKMPEHFAREMCADWAGAGCAQGKNGRSDVCRWYVENAPSIILHPETQMFIQELLASYFMDQAQVLQ